MRKSAFATTLPERGDSSERPVSKRSPSKHSPSEHSVASLPSMDQVQEVLVSLRRVMRATDLHSKQLVKAVGLTAPQLLLLLALRDKGSVPSGEVASDISLSQATVTSILDRLESRGLVARERSQQDKRKVFISLTDKGRETLKDAPTPLQASFIRQFGALQEWEKTMIVSALQRVAQMMDAQDIDASPFLDIGALDRQDEPD